MGERIPYQCHCTGVTQERVLRAMAGLSEPSIEAISSLTGACTGCQSCRCELEALVEEVRAGRVSRPD